MNTEQEARTIFTSAEEVRNFLAPLRTAGKKLVTTNGCFDILHAGHVNYLAEAARFGHILAVGINCDRVVQGLKGPGRPLQNEIDRCQIIGALRVVDCAFIFRENDPRAFLEILKPDIHVKGGDYTNEILEKDVVERGGGVVRIVSFLPGRSTTLLVNKIRG